MKAFFCNLWNSLRDFYNDIKGYHEDYCELKVVKKRIKEISGRINLANLMNKEIDSNDFVQLKLLSKTYHEILERINARGAVVNH